MCDAIAQRGQAAIHFAASNGDVGLIQLLHARGANVDLRAEVTSALGYAFLTYKARWACIPARHTRTICLAHASHIRTLTNKYVFRVIGLHCFSRQQKATAMLSTYSLSWVRQ
jgi:ankyrin repeat protein